jgi:hypothetical protein
VAPAGPGTAEISMSCGRQLLGAADLLDLAVVDHDDLVGDLEGLLLVLGDSTRI